MSMKRARTPERENEALREQSKAKPGQLSLKVSAKGAVSVYGLGRFPVTLYQEQWLKLLDRSDEIELHPPERRAVEEERA